MILDILNKILFILFVMCSLNVIRHVYYFIQAWVKSSSDAPKKYIISGKSLWVLSISLSYLINAIINGINI